MKSEAMPHSGGTGAHAPIISVWPALQDGGASRLPHTEHGSTNPSICVSIHQARLPTSQEAPMGLSQRYGTAGVPGTLRYVADPGHRLALSMPDRRPSHRAQWIRPRRIQGAQISGLRLRAITPLQDYTVVPLGDPLSPGDGSQSPLPPPLRVAERNSPSPDSTVVAFGEAMPHSDGRESTPPYLRMAGHFWWSRLPHTEIPSRLFHILSEARGCRRAGIDVEHPLWRTTPIGTGVAVFLRNRPGPSIPSPSHFLRHSYGGRSQMRQGVNPSPEGQGPRSSGRTLPLVHFPSRDDRPVAQGVGAPSGASTPLTPPTKGSAY